MYCYHRDLPMHIDNATHLSCLHFVSITQLQVILGRHGTPSRTPSVWTSLMYAIVANISVGMGITLSPCGPISTSSILHTEKWVIEKYRIAWLGGGCTWASHLNNERTFVNPRRDFMLAS